MFKKCTALWRKAHLEVNTAGSEHFWKFRRSKSARSCGANGCCQKNTSSETHACLPHVWQSRAPRHRLPTASSECLESFDQAASGRRFVRAPAAREKSVVHWCENRAATFFEAGIRTSCFIPACLEGSHRI